eukprot:5942791-Pleurochrysis_carterae.AAC.1
MEVDEGRREQGLKLSKVAVNEAELAAQREEDSPSEWVSFLLVRPPPPAPRVRWLKGLNTLSNIELRQSCAFFEAELVRVRDGKGRLQPTVDAALFPVGRKREADDGSEWQVRATSSDGAIWTP